MPDHPLDDRTYIRDDGRIVLTGVVLYRCHACQKDHITGLWTSTRPTHCPCGDPFPLGEFFQWRTVPMRAPAYYRDSPSI